MHVHLAAMSRQQGNKHHWKKAIYCIYPNLGIFTCLLVPVGSSSRGGNVMIYVFDIKQPSLPTPFYSVLVSISVFMALSTVFHSINFPDNSPLSLSVLPVLILPLLILSTIYRFMKVSFSSDRIHCGWLSLIHQLTYLSPTYAHETCTGQTTVYIKAPIHYIISLNDKVYRPL